MKINWYVTKQSMAHWKNQRRNKKIPRDKWKWSPTIQNLWDVRKEVLREKFKIIQSYSRKKENLQINNLILQWKQPEKEGQTKLKVSRRNEIIKIQAEINEIEMTKTINEQWK